MMNSPHEIEKLARLLLDGQLSVEDFAGRICEPGIADVGEAQVDLDRSRRCGFPEVVFSQGKSVEAMEKIFTSLVTHGVDVFATRMSVEQATVLEAKFPGGRYNPVGRTFRIPLAESKAKTGKVAIITAGTSDLPVAEEARETADWTGAEVITIQDVGVAGPHRLKANLPLIESADAVVVVAGMEGALPSVVGGHVACPVIAVPTSVGYGASFGGLAALLGMLNSCASNVTVVNIDAGFKGGYIAGLIAKNVAESREL
jgi:pyridinium-3,5-biscarboxylic acid mononucleotide synthase